MSENQKPSDLAALTVQLLGAYLVNNTVPPEDLAGLIRSTRAALGEDQASAQPEAEAARPAPAVSVRKSLASPDHILSLIDGKPYKTLKRHLGSHGLTPDAYREHYGLPASYPMVSPTFAAMRRSIAKEIGLGNRKSADAPPATETTAAPKAEKPLGESASTAVRKTAKRPGKLGLFGKGTAESTRVTGTSGTVGTQAKPRWKRPE